MIQSPARLLAVRIMRETPLDLKGYGFCRERYCLWAVPLLILDFAVLAAQYPRCSVWSIGRFFIFGDMEAQQVSIPYNFVPGVSLEDTPRMENAIALKPLDIRMAAISCGSSL